MWMLQSNWQIQASVGEQMQQQNKTSAFDYKWTEHSDWQWLFLNSKESFDILKLREPQKD